MGLEEREKQRRGATEPTTGTPGRDLVCAACGARITHEDHRIAVAGAHEHTFVNPDGYVHHLGCFAVASHLSEVGPTETAFSWFPGYTWQIVNCRACQTHLGWIYRCRSEQFTGLLVAKLRPAPPAPA